jgi:hypothetical protein
MKGQWIMLAFWVHSSFWVLSLALISPVASSERWVWYDEFREIPIWESGYSVEHQSPIYSESPHPHARKQVLTGRIIIVFLQDKSVQAVEDFMRQYHLVFIKKIPVGTRAYLFQAEGKAKDSLQIANAIYRAGFVWASYPDWLSLNP